MNRTEEKDDVFAPSPVKDENKPEEERSTKKGGRGRMSVQAQVLFVNLSAQFIIVDYKASWGHPGNTKGGSITVQLTSCLTGLESSA
jgi:hypothetical protein